MSILEKIAGLLPSGLQPGGEGDRSAVDHTRIEIRFRTNLAVELQTVNFILHETWFNLPVT